MKQIITILFMLVLMGAQTGFSLPPFMQSPPLWEGPLPGSAQNSTPQNGGARAFSMGGVYTPTNQGVDALNGNPAGIAFTKGWEVAAAGRLRVLGKNDFDESAYADLQEVDYESKFGLNPKLLNLSAAYPVIHNKTSLVGAVGYRSVYDISYRETISLDQTGMISEDVTRCVSGLINTLTIGIGACYDKKYAVGFSYNFPVMSGFEENEETEDRYLTDNQTSKTILDIKSKIDGGDFIQFGGMFQVTSALMVGGSYMMNHDFKIKDLSYNLKADGETVMDEKTEDYTEINVPGLWSLGASYKVFSKLLLAAEMQNRPWNKYEADGHKFTNLKSGASYRAGVEYGTGILLRAGFGMERIPVMDKNHDPVDIKFVTGGVGYQYGKFTLDLGAAYRFATFDAEGSLMNIIFDIEGDYEINEIIVYATVKMNL